MSIKINAIEIRDEIIAGENTANRVGSNLVEIADDLIAKQTAIGLNAVKNSYPGADATKLSNIATGAEVNTIDSSVTGEPAGSDVVLNIVTLTTAEFTAGTKKLTTLYGTTD